MLLDRDKSTNKAKLKSLFKEGLKKARANLCFLYVNIKTKHFFFFTNSFLFLCRPTSCTELSVLCTFSSALLKKKMAKYGIADMEINIKKRGEKA